MMRKIIWILLGISSLFADVRVPKPWNPGFFDGEKNPAQRISSFRMGLLWTEPMEGVDYEVLGFASEWGNDRFYVGMDYSSAFLDSLYRSEKFGLDLSISFSQWTFGLGGTADVQIVPGEASWWDVSARLGSSLRVGAFDCGILSVLSKNLEENAVDAQVHWNALPRFQSGVQVLFRRRNGTLLIFQESLILGALFLQGSVAFPGPKIGVGIGILWGDFLSTFGTHRDGSYMNSKMAGLIVSKKLENESKNR